MKKITHSEAIVLQAVAKGYRHGFDVIEQTGIAGGTVYPALRRLERQRMVSSRWERATLARSEGRPPRKYYEITKQGMAALEVALERYLFLRPFAQVLPLKGEA